MRRTVYLIATLAAFYYLCACSSKSGDEAPAAEGGKSSATQESTPAAPVDPPANPASFPEVVAKVNGTEIGKSELLEQAKTIETQAGGSLDTSTLSFYRSVLDDLVGAELLYQSSLEKHLAAGTADVDKQIEGFRGRFPNPQAFEQALASQGMTLDALKKRIQRDMSIQKLIETDIESQVTVTEDAKKKFYEENGDKMRQPDRLRVSHILKRVAPDATPEAKAAARKEIDGLLAKAQGGADFAALAREHSEDPGSAPNGGELVIGRGETVPPFEDAAFALQPGGLSPVVETQFGFHIIKLNEKIEGQLVPYEQASARIEQFLKQQDLQKKIQTTVETLKGKAQVEVFIG